MSWSNFCPASLWIWDCSRCIIHPSKQHWLTLPSPLSPGRFFSTHELKLLFAHIVLNYDFKFLDEKPRSIYLSDFCFMPEEVFFEACRRERSAHLDMEA